MYRMKKTKIVATMSDFRCTEELTALGLDVPLTAKLCAALKARGIDIDCDFTTEDFADKVLAYAASHPKKEGDA